MTESLSIPNDTRVTAVIYDTQATALCSVGRAPFFCEVSLEMWPADRLLEFEAFDRWVCSIASVETTIEGLCRILADKVVEALGDIPLRVSCHGRTTVHGPATAVIEERIP